MCFIEVPAGLPQMYVPIVSLYRALCAHVSQCVVSLLSNLPASLTLAVACRIGELALVQLVRLSQSLAMQETL